MNNSYVLITGASSGIGQATAWLLSKKYPLILGGRDVDRLKETRSICENTGEHILWPYDLEDVNGIVESMLSIIVRKSISIKGFIHSAGIAPLMPLRMTSLEYMYGIMNVNFFSAVQLLKFLSNKKWNDKALDRVVFISSIHSSIGAKGQSLYCASKAALEGFARAMAVELSPRVRINVICPGGIETPIGKIVQENRELLAKSVSDGYLLGLGDVDDIACMVEYLISEKGKWITGQVFRVDGGRSIT